MICLFCRATLKDVSDYLKTLPCSSIKTMKAGANILDEGIVQAIENAVDKVMVNTVDSCCLELG